jgi:uncharacterized SAM-binding protein YcdF (DUF218 family)
MIRRLLALALLIWILGFAWFAFLLPQPADLSKTDAIVVLTGGPNRIDRGLQLLAAGQAKRMLISGVDRDVRPPELSAQYPGQEKLFACCVDLGFHAVDTHSNGTETALWVKKYRVKSIRLVTHDWHMRRARLELDQALPGNIRIINDAVMTRPTLAALFKEYNKYWVRGFTALIGF